MKACSIKMKKIHQPVFFIGMPRSGTTLIFEHFARHQQLAWLSNYCEMWPGAPFLNILRPFLDNKIIKIHGNKKQYGTVRFGNRYYPQPDEAYAFWDKYTTDEFSRSYLLKINASEKAINLTRAAVGQVIFWQKKKRFTTKLTGPGRIHYLHSIFPDAKFVHVIRDGRSVAHSLLNVGFWKEKGGLDRPFWNNGLNKEKLEVWQKNRSDPALLAVLQWRQVIESARDESRELSHDNYIEVRYEDFIVNQEDTMEILFRYAGLSYMDVFSEKNDNANVINMNDKYKSEFDIDTLKLIELAVGGLLSELGYINEN